MGIQNTSNDSNLCEENLNKSVEEPLELIVDNQSNDGTCFLSQIQQLKSHEKINKPSNGQHRFSNQLRMLQCFLSVAKIHQAIYSMIFP